jgi:hypothetical protein
VNHIIVVETADNLYYGVNLSDMTKKGIAQPLAL